MQAPGVGEVSEEEVSRLNQDYHWTQTTQEYTETNKQCANVRIN